MFLAHCITNPLQSAPTSHNVSAVADFVQLTDPEGLRPCLGKIRVVPPHFADFAFPLTKHLRLSDPKSRAAESESESELESVGVDNSARSWSRSRSHQNLTDSDSGVGVNAAWLNAMHWSLNLFDWRYTALDIIFFEKKTFSVLDERFQRKKRKTVDSPEPAF